jgi:hypothetical protein
MADSFDIVAIRIEDEGPKVGLMVLGAKTGTTVVAPDRRYGRLVESPHCVARSSETSPPTASRTEPISIGSIIPLATSSANLRKPCMRSSRMPPHGRAGEVPVGAAVAATRKDPGERRRSVARFRRLQRPAY